LVPTLPVQFLQDATIKLREMWESRAGEQIGSHEAMALNGVLTQFFGDKTGDDS
jgi:hypothetical protein